MEDVVTLEFVKSYLNIPDTDSSYDDLISFLIPHYTHIIWTEKLNIQTTDSTTPMETIRACISAAIACHISSVDPEAFQALYRYKVLNVEEEYQRRQNEEKTWCDTYQELLELLEGKYVSGSRFATTVRRGYEDEFGGITQ